VGRKPKIDDGVVTAICKALEIGVPLRFAAESNGVSESTVHEWLRRGDAGEKPYADFSAAATRARAKAVLNLTTIALGGGKGSSAAQWFLERRYREHYGPIQRLEHSGPDGTPLKIARTLDELDVETLRRLADS
jgi:hypothetical protein